MPTIAVNGTTLAYDDSGPRDGIPLLLSHSLFFDRTMFGPLVDLLPGYRVVRYDHRGQGGSAPAPREQLDMDTLTADAAALVEALDLGPVHVLGNSMGGFVALRLGVRRPDLVRSVVAMGSSAEEEHQVAEFAPLVDALATQGPEPLVDVLMHIMFGDTTLADPDPAHRKAFGALPNRIADAAHGVVFRASIVEELAATTVPVLAIAGAEDHAYPPPISSANIAAATGGEHVTIPGAGHSVALEQPAAVAEVLLSRLRG